jgi:hypothetical protein
MCVSCTGHVPRDVVVMGNTDLKWDLEARAGEPHSTLPPPRPFSVQMIIFLVHILGLFS